MSVFSKLSITALLVAAPGVTAGGFGKSVELNEKKDGFTLNWEKVTHESVFNLVKDNKVVEAITAKQGAATSWDFDGRIVTVEGFREVPAVEAQSEKAGKLKLKPAKDGESEIELTLGAGNKLTEEDAKKYNVANGMKKGAEVTLNDTPESKFTVVEEITPHQPEIKKQDAQWTATKIEDAAVDIEFQVSGEECVGTSGDLKFECKKDDFGKLAVGDEITDKSKKSTYTLTEIPAGTEADKKTVKATLKGAKPISGTPSLTFTSQNGKMVGVEDAVKGKVLAVVARSDMTYTSSTSAQPFADKTALIAHMLTQAKIDGQQWYLKIATAHADKAWYQDAMNWVYISLAVVAVAVVCFFVFGGKKATDSDDESDLDTSDDEEEDAAATEAKEEEA